MAAYYNEFDPFAAQWLRELIKAGCIAPGEVDERSIADVRPDDLVGFTQCHFFAGIGVWSYALRLAGWNDTRPVWTGSCPCQPFSAAGKGAGSADERHLWPVFFELIRACRPPVVLGEQVASSAVIGSAAKRRVVAPSCGTVGAGDERVWLDAVFDDLEAASYIFGAVSFPACGVGSPHIRQRLYWVANAEGCGAGTGLCHSQPGGQRRDVAADFGTDGGLADAGCTTSERNPGGVFGEEKESGGERVVDGGCPFGHQHGGSDGGMAHAESNRQRADESCRDSLGGEQLEGSGARGDGCDNGATEWMADSYEPGLQPWERDDQAERYWHTVAAKSVNGMHGPARPTAGYWRDADWLFCRDGKWRAVEPGTFPLAHGATARVGRLRGYGNAIVAPQAAAFIGAVMEEIA